MKATLDPLIPKPDDTLQIEAVWESAYEQVVRPEKVIALNAYFIRHLSILGPELGWMYIGFRQAAYGAGGRSGQRTARFSGKTIADLGGSSERTFWNRAAKPETWQKLAGLVTLVDEKPLWDEKSQMPKRLPRKYSVAMTLPLTAPDTSALRCWITEHIKQYHGAAGVLAAACETPIDELLEHPGTFREISQSLTVHRLVRDLFSTELPEKELQALGERLHLHIQPPGDLLVLTLFFVEHILPHLGTGPGWLLAILRDRCWVDPKSGTTRSLVTVHGGYAEMAGWLGLSRPMTVYEWLREPVLQIYLHYLCNSEGNGEGEVTKWNTGRVFDVLLEEVPVEIVQMALSDADPVTRFTVSDVDPVTQFTGSSGADCSIGVTRFTVSSYADFSIAVTQITEFSYAICRVFKLLSSLRSALELKTKPEPTPEIPVALPAAPMVDNSKALGANAPVCLLENPTQLDKINLEERLQAFPEDLRSIAAVFVTEFNLLPPAKPEPGEKGGDFALWIKGLRQLNQIAADYGIPTAKALQLTHAYWNERPFTVAHPLALKNTLHSVLARQKAALTVTTPAPTADHPAYSPNQRRQEISARLGFDIDQPLTPAQQATLQTYLDGQLSKLPPNPLKNQSGGSHV